MSGLGLLLFLSWPSSPSDPSPPAYLGSLNDSPWQRLLPSEDRHIIRELRSVAPAPGGGMTVRQRPGAHLTYTVGIKDEKWKIEI